MSLLSKDKSNLLSHKKIQNENFDKIHQELIKKIQQSNLDIIMQDELLKSLSKVTSTEMGKFLVENSGFNGFWTEYMCSYPETKKLGFNLSENIDENYIMENFPIAIATQSRYQIFKAEIKKRLKNNISIASLPCGLMNDILSQNFQDCKNFKLHGIDLDQSSIQQAKAISLTKGLTYHCKFTQEDAWEINYKNEYDMFISNGLNIYVDDDNKLIEMYKKIHTSLKNNGELITSTIVPSPDISKDSSWKMEKINPESYKLQKIVHEFFMNFSNNNLRTSNHLCKILEKSGFSNFEVIPDVLGIFVTVIAKKCG